MSLVKYVALEGFLKLVEVALDETPPPDKTTALTNDAGALVRQHGPHVAHVLCAVERACGRFHKDNADLTQIVLPPHRRRLK